MYQFIVAMFFMLVGIIVPVDAFAYLDPGAGSVLLQGILGGLAAIGVVLQLYWHRILRFLGIRNTAPDNLNKVNSEKTDSESEER